MTYVLRLTRAEHMALTSILGDQLKANPSFVDCSQDPPVTTTAADLFQIVMTATPTLEPKPQ